MLCLCSLLGALLAFAPIQGGDDKGILGKDDLDFARALIRNGYADLADRLCTALEKNRANVPGDMLGAQSTRVDIQFDLAWREPDLKKRKELLQGVLAAKNEFVNAHVGTAEAADALETLPDLVRFIGDTISALLEKEEDEAAKEALRKEAAELFGPAESLLRKQVGNARGELDRLTKDADPDVANPALDEASINYLVAFSSLARTYYFHSIVLDAADPERAKLLEQVISMFDEIELDFAETLACFDGFIFRGLALKSLGKPNDAIKSFDAAIKLRQFFDKTQQGVWQVAPESADLISNAVLQKMLALKEQGDHPGAIAAANDFLTTIQGALQSVKGIRVMMALVDEYDASGDGKNRDKTANKLIEVDPNGPGGQRGREILGGGGSNPTRLGADNALQLAGTLAAQGEQEKAIQLCQQILTMIRGTNQEQNLGAETCLLLGALYAQRTWLEEAAVAWDTAVERYPSGVKTPDALWRSINCYLTIWGKTKRGAYEKLMRARIGQLTSLYPKSPYAQKVALIEVQRLENDEKFLEAAALCEKVEPGTAIYEETLFRAGNCYYRHARKLVVDGKTAEAKQFAQKAETLLKKAAVELEAALKRTLDEDQLARLTALTFSTRVSLAGVYLLDGVSKPAEVLPLFEGMEKQYPDDAAKLGTVWDLRFRAMRAQGKMAEGLVMLDAAVKADPKAKGIDKVALAAGKEFDTQAIEKQQKGAEVAAIDELFRKAQTYYVMAMAPQLDGREQPRVSEMEQVAGRLVVIGLHFNRVPKDVASFIDWTGRVTMPEPWEQAKRVYEALLPWSNSSRILICLAQTNGWLGKWKDAATAYARIFEGKSVVDPATKQFSKAATAEMPELPYIYVEWGIVEHRAASSDRDAARYERAMTIFIAVNHSSPKDTKLWWQAKYEIVQINMDRGTYDQAALVMRDIERNAEDFDGGRFGFKEKFAKIKSELDGKLIPGK